MPKEINEQLLALYVNDFDSLADDLPNDVSRVMSELFALDGKCGALLHKLDTVWRKAVRQKCQPQYMAECLLKMESYLTRLEVIYVHKTRLSQTILDTVLEKERELTDDYEGILLNGRSEPLTYGTRSGRLWIPANNASHD